MHMKTTWIFVTAGLFAIAALLFMNLGKPQMKITPEELVNPPVVTSSSSSTSDSTTISTTTPPAKPTLPRSQFDIPVLLNSGDKITFTNGLNITLRGITDSRCKPDVQCIWAGEIEIELAVIGGGINPSQTTKLGTVVKKSAALGDYIFTLIAATETSATITVTRTKLQPVVNGQVSGTVTVGPICPVESIDNPCIIPPEVYTSRTVVVYGPTDSQRIKTTALQSDGTYSLSLAPGTYWLQIEPAGIRAGEKKIITILANETTNLNFDIDSGIR